jgi:hypothetical protein
MNRPYLERSIGGASRAGVFAATVAAAILANSATWSAALAQQPGSVVQQRVKQRSGICSLASKICLPAWCKMRRRCRPN